jgi:hypothetical protein
MARSFTPTLQLHVAYYATNRKPRPATVVSVGSVNGGIVLRITHTGQVLGNGTTGILRGTVGGAHPRGVNVWSPA